MNDSIIMAKQPATGTRLLWVDATIDRSEKQCQDTLQPLRTVIADVKLFTDPDACVEFLLCLRSEKFIVITSGALGQNLVEKVHCMAHVVAIYVFCANRPKHELWARKWSKIQGVFTKIEPLCEALQTFATESSGDSNEVPAIDQLEPSFMYTRLFKSIFLGMKHDNKSGMAFARYCRKIKTDLPVEIKVIDEFECQYCPEEAIWWYTRECFVHKMLNRALRRLEADVIVTMGFFIHDLHRQIEKLHRKQMSQHGRQPFTVYRGQGLSASDFEKLKSSEGGLLSFNSFLGTTKDRDLAWLLAEGTALVADKVGILFVMTIDPSMTSIPFADIGHARYFSKDTEVLFAMNSVFRVGQIKDLGKDGKFFEVRLTLTTDEDPQLRLLGERLEEEIQGENDSERIVKLLIKVGQLDKAQEFYIYRLGQASNEEERARCNHQLGFIYSEQGDYPSALSYLGKTLNIRQKTLPAQHPDLATAYNDIGSMYYKSGDYPKALSSFQEGLDIRAKVLPADHPDLATSYNNLGSVHSMMGEYSNAVLFIGKGLAMCQRALPLDHPTLATVYSNMGSVYFCMGEYSTALCWFEKGLEMRQRLLPADHPALAASYNDIGSVYSNVGDYAQALLCLEKALDIRHKTFLKDHPALATSYNDIGSVYSNMGDHQKALSYLWKGLDIREEAFPPNHPALATSCHTIGLVYYDMQEYSKALSFLEKGLDIRHKAFPIDHPITATSYNDIGSVYIKMDDYQKALPCLERALDIRKRSLPSTHPGVQETTELITIVKVKALGTVSA